jgi:2-iminobutanoate/2-iminopropanoate deaminase
MTNPPAIPPYSTIRQAGSFYFVSGAIGMDMTTKIAESDVSAQTAQALKNMASVLESAGLTLQDVVKTTVFLTDMGDFGAMNAVYGETFAKPYPARSCIAVAELPRVANLPLKVEIEAVATRA